MLAKAKLRQQNSDPLGGFTERLVGGPAAMPWSQEAAGILSGLLSPGGVLLISVRDYDLVNRARTSFQQLLVADSPGPSLPLGQEWTWLDENHHRTEMVIEEDKGEGWREVMRTAAEYYAVS